MILCNHPLVVFWNFCTQTFSEPTASPQDFAWRAWANLKMHSWASSMLRSSPKSSSMIWLVIKLVPIKHEMEQRMEGQASSRWSTLTGGSPLHSNARAALTAWNFSASHHDSSRVGSSLPGLFVTRRQPCWSHGPSHQPLPLHCRS